MAALKQLFTENIIEKIATMIDQQSQRLSLLTFLDECEK